MEKNLENTGVRPQIDDSWIGSERKNSLLSSQTSNKSEMKKIGENTKPHFNSIKVENASVESGVRYSCDVCDHTATTKGNIKIHVRSVHKWACYSCHLCNFKATQRVNLTVHIESVHERNRCSCNHCNYKASQKSNLYTHNKKTTLFKFQSSHCTGYFFIFWTLLCSHKFAKHFIFRFLDLYFSPPVDIFGTFPYLEKLLS